MILAGDVGGTKCNLGLFQQEGSRLRSVFKRRFATQDYAGFEDLVEDFLEQAQASDANLSRQSIDAAGFGVAGVVLEGRHYAENLPWSVDASVLSRKLNLNSVRLINDLVAAAFSLRRLSANDIVALNPGTPVQNGTKAVIAAGTGLGTSILFWDGEKYRVALAEAGQADFAPRTKREIALLSYLRMELPQVSCEQIVSGRGFRRIHEFLEPAVRHESFESPAGNASHEISQRGLTQSCSICVETLRLWIEIFGAMAGNFALQVMAVGGIYIAGGIPVKILPALQDGVFFKSFSGSGKLASVLARIPILVVVNEDAPMVGAAYEALVSRDCKATSK
jgi:glucokinase